MLACTFFGHRECYGLDRAVLETAIENVINQGVNTFYVGNQGGFDRMVYSCLRQMREKYPQIHIGVVLAYHPVKPEQSVDMSDTMYPELTGHPRFALERRNRWMIVRSNFCICYINHTWGGAYKFVRLARSRGLTIINLGVGEV